MSTRSLVFWSAFGGGGFIAIMVDDWPIKLPLALIFAMGCGVIGAWHEARSQ